METDLVLYRKHIYNEKRNIAWKANGNAKMEMKGLIRGSYELSKRGDSDHNQEAHKRARRAPQSSSRSSRALGLGLTDGLIDKVGSAAHIDDLGRLGVIGADGLAFVRRHRVEIAHCRLQTLGAGQLAPSGEGHAQREIVDVAVGGGGVVGDGVGEAVFVGAVFQAGGLVERGVGDEAGVGLAHDGVLQLVVCGAVAVELELLGEARH